MDVAVTQITSGVTAVTANGQTGLITTVSLVARGRQRRHFYGQQYGSRRRFGGAGRHLQLQRHDRIPDGQRQQLHCGHIVRHRGVERARQRRAQRNFEDWISTFVEKATTKRKDTSTIDVSVTQATSTTTAVTANGQNGLITCFTSTLAAATPATFTVNNTATDSDSVVLTGITNYSGTTGTPIVRANNCVAGT